MTSEVRSERVLRLLKLLETSRQSQVSRSARVPVLVSTKPDSTLRSGIRGESIKRLTVGLSGASKGGGYGLGGGSVTAGQSGGRGCTRCS